MATQQRHGSGTSQHRDAPAHRRTIHFSGHVQGVGFRYTAQNIAIQHAVTGYVRNLEDGRVELVIEGDPGELDAVLTALRQRMTDFIQGVRVEDSPANGQFARFCIRH